MLFYAYKKTPLCAKIVPKSHLYKKSYHKSKTMCYNKFTPKGKGRGKEVRKMVLIGTLIVLVINEYSSGEGWYKGVIKGLMGAAGLIWAATVSPARTFVICMMVLCALVAVELARIDDKRKSAAERLKVLDERAEERKARNARRGLHITKRTRRSRAA